VSRGPSSNTCPRCEPQRLCSVPIFDNQFQPLTNCKRFISLFLTRPFKTCVRALTLRPLFKGRFFQKRGVGWRLLSGKHQPLLNPEKPAPVRRTKQGAFLTIFQPISTQIPIDLYELLFYNYTIYPRPPRSLLKLPTSNFADNWHKWHKNVGAIAEIAAIYAIPVIFCNVVLVFDC
jgi:hypothetical protein